MGKTSQNNEDSQTSPEELREREKELDFVYSLASLLSASGLDEGRVARHAADLFRNALTRPERAQVQVCINGICVASPAASANRIMPRTPGNDVQGKTLGASAGDAGNCWLEASYDDGSLCFLEREVALGESAARLLAISARRMVLDRHDSVLKLDLERKNAALSELLSRIELEKKSIRDTIAARLRDRVFSLLTRMEKTGFPAEWTVEIRRELELSVAGSSGRDVSLRSLLSSRELEICTLVADGLSSKEIACRLGLACATVERHRHNARRKLGLPARQGSLGTIHFDTDL